MENTNATECLEDYKRRARGVPIVIMTADYAKDPALVLTRNIVTGG